MTVTAAPPTVDKRGLIIDLNVWPMVAEWLKSQDVNVVEIATAGRIPHFHVSRRPIRTAAYLLTERELQVLTGMSQGKSNGTMAREFYLSEDTVKSHASRLFRKLGAKDRAQAVAIGYQRGILGGEA